MLPVPCKKLQASELSSTLLKIRYAGYRYYCGMAFLLLVPTNWITHPDPEGKHLSRSCMSSCSPCSECIHYRDLANDGVRDGCALASGRSSSAKTYHTNCKHHECCGVWFRASIAEASARRVLRIFGGGDDHCARWCGQWPGWLRSLQLAHATELCALWR